MRKAAICTMLALSTLVAACGSTSGNPSAVEANTIGASAPATTEHADARPSATTDGGSDTTDETDETDAPDTTEAPDTTNRTTTGSAPGTSPADSDFTITWGKADDGVQSGTIEVPVDYDDPSQGTFELHLVRHLAEDPDERIGSLLVNPGGPGFGGTVLAEQASFVYDKPLLDRFDILAWDPRGTGQSTPFIDCFSDYDHFFDSTDITPDTDAEKQQIIDLAKEAADDCEAKNAKILEHVGTNNSARDMDAIRQALGEDTISYFGFSYGSELGATWATLFPDTVRAAVLDGAADPTLDLDESGLTQTKAFEASLDTFLAQCSADTKCKFHNDGDAEGAFDALMAKLDENPLPALEDRPKLTRGAAITAVSEAMYSDASWPTLATALHDAQRGDGSGLMDLYDEYFQRQPGGSYDNSLEAFNVIRCMDSADRPTVAEEDAFAAQMNQAAPRLSPGTTGSYFCTFFPPSAEPRVTITGKGAGPIVVIGTTGDPATPLDSSRAMAKALENGRLVVVHADQHTGYGVNRCVNNAVDDYLVDPSQVPENELQCA